MEKQKQLMVDNKYVIFVDAKNENDIYCMTQESKNEKNKILVEFLNKEANVPDEHTITAFPIVKVGEKDNLTDLYDVDTTKGAAFPINRIKWVFIRLVKE